MGWIPGAFDGVCGRGLLGILRDNQIHECQNSARTKDPEHFGQRTGGVGKMVQRVRACDYIEGSAGVRERNGVRADQREV